MIAHALWSSYTAFKSLTSHHAFRDKHIAGCSPHVMQKGVHCTPALIALTRPDYCTRTRLLESHFHIRDL